MALVIVGNKNYVDCLKNMEDWYLEAFISGFTALANHDAHMATVPFPTDDQVMLVLTPYPNKPIMETLPRGDTTHFYLLFSTTVALHCCTTITSAVKC